MLTIGSLVQVGAKGMPVLVVDISPPLRGSDGKPTRLVTIAWKETSGRVGEYTAPISEFTVYGAR